MAFRKNGFKCVLQSDSTILLWVSKTIKINYLGCVLKSINFYSFKY